MFRFVLRRLLLVIPSLAGLLVLTFFLIRVVPADPLAGEADQRVDLGPRDVLDHGLGSIGEGGEEATRAPAEAVPAVHPIQGLEPLRAH